MYSAQLEQIKVFLSSFRHSIHRQPTAEQLTDDAKYENLVNRILRRQTRCAIIDLDDVIAFSATILADKIIENPTRYQRLFAEAIDQLLDAASLRLANENASDDLEGPSSSSSLGGEWGDMDVIDMLNLHRKQQIDQENSENQTELSSQRPPIPPILLRRFQVSFNMPTDRKATPLREISSPYVGHLVKLKGIVTRITQVKPLVTVATYSCDSCNQETYQTVDGESSFSPLVRCTSVQCQQQNSKGKLILLTRGSKFIPFQHMFIQEISSDVPVGKTPISLPVHLTGEFTRTCSPGDYVTITGIYLPKKIVFNFHKTSGKSPLSNLVSDTFVQCHGIYKHKVQLTKNVMEKSQQQLFLKLANSSNTPQSSAKKIYDSLAASIAPEVYGHLDVKKALLLCLIGGVTQLVKADSMRIRGDIHVCLMGDPGVAKSQLLKSLCTIAPRAIYTTGKGSTGVGLTAAVIRDPHTSELILEGGALVLGDTGICCIDEFDKMDESDRTAIHEVMEQQTVSIAKAGITTTLNARTSVIAACNPAYGRYRLDQSPSDNINLPAALLSRFDLLFVIVDRPNPTKDYFLALHVTSTHKHKKANVDDATGPTDSSSPEITSHFKDIATIRNYISFAKTFTPTFPPSLTSYVASTYTAMRAEDVSAGSIALGYTSARSLLGIVRLAQAHARVRLSNRIEKFDIDEAIRLIYNSKSSLFDEDDNGIYTSGTSHRRIHQKSKALNQAEANVLVYDIIRSLANFGNRDDNPAFDANLQPGAHRPIETGIVWNRSNLRGVTREQFDAAINHYEHTLNLLVRDGTTINLLYSTSMA